MLAVPFICLADDADSKDVDDAVEKGSSSELTLDEIGMELMNPATSMVSFKTDFHYTFYQGSLADASDESAYVINFQPSFPIPLSNGRNILLRLNIPLNGDQPLYEIPGSDKELSTYQIRRMLRPFPKMALSTIIMAMITLGKSAWMLPMVVSATVELSACLA